MTTARVRRIGRRTRRAWLIAIAAFAAFAATLSATAAGAQTAASRPAAGLTLDSALRAALANNTKIRYDALRAENFRGQVVAAAGPFDAQLRTSVTNGHDNTQLPVVRRGVPVEAWTTEDAVSYDVRVDKQFRSGIVMSPTLSVTRTNTRAIESNQFPTRGSGSARLNVTMPLLSNRGGAVTAAAERVTELDYRGTISDSRHTAASTSNDVAAAYWNYLAAQQRVETYRAAEARAQRMLDETTILVQKDERAPADLKQLGGNLASKRATRIGAEQSLVEARQQLGLMMGLSAADVAALPPAIADFPAATIDSSKRAAEVARLTSIALEHRADLGAAREKNAATVLELAEFRNAAKPRADLIVGVGFVGSEDNVAFSRFFAPVYRNVPGLNASVQLAYQLPTTNAAARGRVMQEEAFLAQQRLALIDAERQTGVSVSVGVESVERSSAVVEQLAAATTLAAATVQNERRKFQLGTSTLFDILNAEDGLTNAQLAEVNGRRAHATALANLRFVTGTLVEWDGERAFVRPGSLGTLP